MFFPLAPFKCTSEKNTLKYIKYIKYIVFLQIYLLLFSFEQAFIFFNLKLPLREVTNFYIPVTLIAQFDSIFLLLGWCLKLLSSLMWLLILFYVCEPIREIFYILKSKSLEWTNENILLFKKLNLFSLFYVPLSNRKSCELLTNHRIYVFCLKSRICFIEFVFILIVSVDSCIVVFFKC